jgi:hypothetical protein
VKIRLNHFDALWLIVFCHKSGNNLDFAPS